MSKFIKKVREGMFLISWTAYQIGSLSLDIKQIFANHTCNLIYEFHKYQTDNYVLWLEILDNSTKLSVYPGGIKTITVTRNGVEKQMEKILFVPNQTPDVTKLMWKSSWTETNLLLCLKCGNWTTPTSDMFEIAIELDSFSVDLIRTNKKLKSVHEAVKQIRENQDFVDVKFMCQNETITGNSSILSAGSPVLAAMFRHDFQEKKEMVVEITDITANVFKQLIQYLYIQDADLENFEDVAGLFVAADKYDVDSLKEECEIHLSENLSSANAVRYLVLGHVHEAPRLLESSLRYLAKNPQAIHYSDKDWLKVMKNYPKMALDVIKSITTKGYLVST